MARRRWLISCGCTQISASVTDAPILTPDVNWLGRDAPMWRRNAAMSGGDGPMSVISPFRGEMAARQTGGVSLKIE
jgi:hypothetical protein